MTDISRLLKLTFGYESFREGQKEVIGDLLAGHNVFARMPTGSGKSLCYILTGYALKGSVLIISPLLSLMEDQVHQLKLIGEKRVIALNSFMNFQERSDRIKELECYKFIFLSPEMLQNPFLQRKLKDMIVSLFVVDEAHCISQWGHDFRPDYLKLPQLYEWLNNPLCLALTATATDQVMRDIDRCLPLENAKKHLYSVDRRNLFLKVDILPTLAEKLEAVVKWTLFSPGAVVIYCGTREWAESLALHIAENTGRASAYYHGGMANEDRLLIQQQFINDQLEVICATTAFGMGINKKNIRMVIHFHTSRHMNEYVQEIGRAGRDGEQAYAVTLYTEGDEALGYHLIEATLPEASVLKEIIQFVYTNYDKTMHRTIADFLIASNVNETVSRYLDYYLTEYTKDAEGAYKSQIIIDKIERIKHDKMKEMNNMMSYLLTQSCRRNYLLTYYNEDTVPPVCDSCDHCVEVPTAIPLDETRKK